jgi:uracil-DNA glycosylase family 4
MPISSKKSLKNLSEEVLACKQCLDLVKTRKTPVPGVGAPNSKLIIVGYHPTESGAENSGVPFSKDEEGELIRKVLNEVGLSLNSDTYLSYLVKCTPRKIARKKGKDEIRLSKPAGKHVKNCINYLTEEISVITPHIILTLGLDVSNIILERFFSTAKKYRDMSKLHMRLFENPSFKLIPFYSPHDISSGLITMEKYTEDFRSLSRLFAII